MGSAPAAARGAPCLLSRHVFSRMPQVTGSAPPFLPYIERTRPACTSCMHVAALTAREPPQAILLHALCCTFVPALLACDSAL